MLTITPEAVYPPGRCSASGTETGPFIDTGFTVLARHPRTQISVPWVMSIAGDLGLVPATELSDALTDLDAALAEVQVLRARVERFDEDVQNVADAMASFAAEVLTA